MLLAVELNLTGDKPVWEGEKEERVRVCVGTKNLKESKGAKRKRVEGGRTWTDCHGNANCTSVENCISARHAREDLRVGGDAVSILVLQLVKDIVRQYHLVG